MRKIKFRTWVKLHRYYVYPETAGYMNFGLTIQGNVIHISGQYPILGQNNDDYHFEQFTDLMDKNRKEIYEGDIVRSDRNHLIYTLGALSRVSDNKIEIYSFGEVKWVNSGFSVCQPYIGRTLLEDFASCHCCPCALEVIGNIHENPELLKL